MRSEAISNQFPRWARFAVCALLAVVLFAGLNLAGGSAADLTGPAAAPLQDSVPAASDFASPGRGNGLLLQSGDVVAQPQLNDSQARLVAANEGEELNLLPAWRWRNGTGALFASYGFVGGIAERPINAFAQLFFTMASWMWWLVLGAMSFALSLDLFELRDVGSRISSIFAAFGNTLVSSGLVLLLLGFALVSAVLMGVKGKIGGAVSTVIAAVIPIAFLFALTSLASQGAGQTNAGMPPGSPVWIAQKGLSVVDEVSAGIPNAISQAAGVGSGSSAVDRSGYAQLSPSCVAYKNTLYDTFDAWRNGQVSGPDDGVDYSNNSSAVASLKTVSYMWEQAMLSNWVTAQWGNSQPGLRIYCHQLEANAGISRAEQVEIGQIAGYPSIDAEGQIPDVVDGISDLDDDLNTAEILNYFGGGKMGLGPDGRPQSVTHDKTDPDNWFRDREAGRRDPYLSGPVRNEADQAKLLMWAACYNVDGTRAGWRYQAAWLDRGKLSTEKDRAQHCQEWWYLGVGPDAGTGGESTKLVWADVPGGGGNAAGVDNIAPGGAIPVVSPGGGASSARQDSYDDLSFAVAAFRGDNTAGRALNGLITLITSAAYLYVLGGIAIGALVAKLGFVIMLIILPATLFLLAVPTGGKGRNPTGVKLLRMTGGYMAANFLLTVVLTLLLTTMVLLTQLVAPLPLGGGNGLLNILVPIAALLLLRKVFQAAGLGDIMTPKGAMKLATTAAAGASSKDGFMAGAVGKNARDEAKKSARARKDEAYARGQKLPWGDKMAAWGRKRARDARDNLSDKALRAGSGHGLDDWKQRGPAGRVITASRIAEAATKALRMDAWAPDAANRIRNVGRGITGLNKDRLDRADAEALVADRSKELGRATRGMSDAAERAEKVREIVSGWGDGAALANQAQRDELGVIQRDVNGEAIVNWAFRDEFGNLVTVSAEEAGWDPVTKTVAVGYEVVTEVSRRVAEGAAAAEASVVAETLGVQPGAVLAAFDGTGPMVAPTSTQARTPALCAAVGTTEQAVEVYRNSPHLFLAPEVLDMAAALPSAAQAPFLQRASVAAGLQDPRSGAVVDVLAMHGLSEDEIYEVVAANQLGRPSAIDNVPRRQISAAQLAAIQSSVLIDYTSMQDDMSASLAGAASQVQVIVEETRTETVPAVLGVNRAVEALRRGSESLRLQPQVRQDLEATDAAIADVQTRLNAAVLGNGAGGPAVAQMEAQLASLRNHRSSVQIDVDVHARNIDDAVLAASNPDLADAVGRIAAGGGVGKIMESIKADLHMGAPTAALDEDYVKAAVSQAAERERQRVADEVSRLASTSTTPEGFSGLGNLLEETLARFGANSWVADPAPFTAKKRSAPAPLYRPSTFS
jgi:hypothetical protein